ncbi:MAG: hypothetical protein PHP85_04940 [Gallionella sp.]|nr:hypothetical protein [Gallionella sp.]
MTPYISLSLVFLAAGLALLAAIAYLARLVRRHRRALGALLKLAQHNHPPLQLPAAAWPALADGGIKRLEFSGNWFGQAVQGSFGDAHNACHPFTFKVTTDGDADLRFELYARTNRGEARLFAENLAGVFRLLLETAVQGKMEALSAALSEQTKLTLYLQHDLRNLSQWVGWLATDIAQADNDAALLHIAQGLCVGAPHAAARARRILDATCKSRSTTLPALQPLSLLGAIKEAAEHAGLNVTIEAKDTSVLLRRDLLDRALDNIFANVAPWLRQHAELSILVTIEEEEDRVCAKITLPRLTGITRPESLFEPFSSGRPGGLGLGLYQARKSLNEAGGELVASAYEQHITFNLTLPGDMQPPKLLLNPKIQTAARL